MSKFKKIAILIVVVQILLVGVINWFTFANTNTSGRQYRVDIQRVSRSLIEGQEVNVSDYDSIIAVKPFTEDYRTNNDYAVVRAGDKMYAIEYKVNKSNNQVIYMNIGMALMIATTIGVLAYVNNKVLKPFNNMSNMTVELAKGNLSTPIKEDKNKFFGRFLWGMDMLRDNLETNRKKELDLQKEKKTLILSISHDIKTPLSAIKLYNKALSEDLYDTDEKKAEAHSGINKNVLEIERYVNEIVTASKEDFLNLEAIVGEYYLADIMEKIKSYYTEKFEVLHTEFTVDEYHNFLLKCDMDRIVEVLQNILENAIKYGDGKSVRISFDEEEDCQLISIINSGCSINEDEIPHLFDSFYRGSNVNNKEGSGLGLYIAKSLMRLMDGEVFAQVDGDNFAIVVVVRKV